MDYPLTPAQRAFYPKGLPLEQILWNHGTTVLFHKFYPQKQIQDALHAAIAAFEELRLRFAERDGTPFAYISTESPSNFPYLTLDSRQKVMDAFRELIDTPFDLTGPLYRCTVFDSPEGSGVMFCVHHMIIDGFSAQVVVRFVQAYLEGQADPGEILSYADHFAREQDYRNTRRFQRDRAYWAEQLRLPVAPIFPVGANRIRYAARELILEPDPAWMKRIRKFCQAEAITPTAFFSAVLATCLRREYGHTTVRLGLSVMNRTTQTELRSVGLFMRILPLTVTPDNTAFADCARRTEQQKMDLFRHQKLTQPEIDDMRKAQTPGNKALFDVVFDYQEFPESPQMELLFSYSSALSVPLELHFLDFGPRQKLHIRYRTALFSEAQIQDFSQRFLGIAASAVESPQLPPDALSQYILSPADRRRLLGDWNNTGHIYNVSPDATLYSLFEAYAAAHSADICLNVGDHSMTFGQLRSRAGMLDNAIRQITGHRKSVIALIAERSPEMYTAVYAIIRGGNAYLPIDPNHPPDRIRSILRRSGAVAVLAQHSFASLSGSLPCIDLTAFFRTPSDAHPVLPATAQADDTAYVIYTSGSTGEPKGAMVSHRSAVNRILWMQHAYPLDADCVILQKTPYTFDVSVWELFWWGICGGRLAACSPGEHFLPQKILREVSAHHVTHLHFVPSVFEIFLTYLEAEPQNSFLFSSVRHVFLSGEALSAALVRRFYAMFPYPTVRLHNLYGPTECAIDVTYYDCTPEDVDPIPIGRPIFNTSIYILDPAMNLLPPGKQGELCIGGVNVGQGYRNAPDLTAERFVDNPFGSGKLYKTGDYASFRPDGQILFHGRMDGQLKLNGQRIETGEIEAVICRVPGVEKAAVIPCRRGSQTLLVAFYCGTPGLEPEIKMLCQATLPSYMIPTQFHHLNRFPLNGSGKLDRRALQDLVPQAPEGTVQQPLRTPEEQLVATAFAEILGCSSVGFSSNFFDLGGSSLDMITLLCRSEFEHITPADFIENPTVEAFARLICAPAAQSGWLRRLHRGTNSQNALILFPYAGGEAESFAAFAHCATNDMPELSLYCVNFPHSEADCQAVARELILLAETTHLFVYSHCAGIAPALRVLALLEQQNPHAVRHYFAAAAIPPESPPHENLWRSIPDEMLRTILESAGASFAGLLQEQVTDLFIRFRHDTDFYTQFFQSPPRQIHTPVTLFLSKEDPFTSNFTEAEILWKPYAANFAPPSFINSPSHYFQATQPGILLQQIRRVISP